MSSEMRKLIAKWRADAVDTWNLDMRMWLEECADELEALLARTEAGADGVDNVWHVPDIDYQRMYYAEQQLLALREAATPVAWRSKDFNPLFEGGFAWAFHTNPADVGPQHEPLFTQPQDASGDVERLDWVLENAAMVETDGGGQWRVRFDWTAPIMYFSYRDTPRDAIDTAMQAKEAK